MKSKKVELFKFICLNASATKGPHESLHRGPCGGVFGACGFPSLLARSIYQIGRSRWGGRGTEDEDHFNYAAAY